jgi:nitroreductase
MRLRTAQVPGLPDEVAAACLEAAVLAPSIHNTQPWRFRVGRMAIDVLADRDRQLPVLDPSGRQLLMSIGAAVFNLRLALLARGRMPVQRLLPDPARPDLVARVQAGSTTAPSESAALLAEAIARRHTDRRPFRPAAMPWDVLNDAMAAAAAEGARLTVAEPVVRDAIVALTRTADERLTRNPAYRSELVAWADAAAGRLDGIPRYAIGPRDAAGRLPLRDFTPDRTIDRDTHLAAVTFEPRATLVTLATNGDTPYEWVRAGQALQRVLLTLTARGLAATPMNQALEIPQLRGLITDQKAGRYAQAILRIGYGRPGRATPRRPAEQVLLRESGS